MPNRHDVIVAMHEVGVSYRDIARCFDIDPARAHQIVTKPVAHGGRRGPRPNSKRATYKQMRRAVRCVLQRRDKLQTTIAATLPRLAYWDREVTELRARAAFASSMIEAGYGPVSN